MKPMVFFGVPALSVLMVPQAALAQYNDTVGGVIASVYAPPRTFGVRASVKF